MAFTTHADLVPRSKNEYGYTSASPLGLHVRYRVTFTSTLKGKCKGKVILLQARCGSEGG